MRMCAAQTGLAPWGTVYCTKPKGHDGDHHAHDALIDHHWPKKPGLHKVGPAPWDYEFNPENGMQIACVGADGRTYTGVITYFDENKETGELTLTVQSRPDSDGAPGWNSINHKPE